MTETHFKILLFTDDEYTTRLLERACAKQASPPCVMEALPPPAASEAQFLCHQPQLVLVDLSSLPQHGIENFMRPFERLAESIPFVGICSTLETEDVLFYIKKGIRDFLRTPLDEAEVLKTFGRFQKGMSPGAASVLGKVYTFFSFKGGVGNTFVTTNTAVSDARLTGKRTLLWDMATQSGDVPFFLNFQPKHTLANLLNNLDQIDEEYLRGALPPHANGISVLATPSDVEDGEKISFDAVEKMLPWLRRTFDSIFVDAGCRFSEALIPLMDASSYVFITTTLELISLRRASRCLDILQKLNYTRDKIKIIVNRFHAKHEALSLREAKEILKYDFVQFIPNDYEIASKCVNLGQAVADVAFMSRMNQEFKDLAGKIEKRFAVDEKEASSKKPLMNLLRFAHF